MASVGAARSIRVRTRCIASDSPSSGVSTRRHELGRPAALGARVDAAAAERRRASHRRCEPFIAPRLSNEVACSSLECLDRDRHRAMCGDDHDRGVRVDLHHVAEKAEAFAPVGRSTLEIEVEQDRVWAFRLEERQKLGGSAQCLNAFEQIAKRETRGERDIGIIVDDDGKAERRLHATSVALLSGNEQCPPHKIARFDWHGPCS